MKIEYTEKEFDRLFESVDKFLKRLTKMEEIRMENAHQLDLLRMKKESGQKRHTFIVDDESEEESEEDLFGYDPAPATPERPLQFTVHKAKVGADEVVEQTEPEEKESDSALLDAQKKGREIFEKLVELWLVNFREEGAEQPPRADEVKRLSLVKDGQRLLHFVLWAGGVTHAVKEVWPQEYDGYLIRYVAENITQVCSILFPELGTMLEHPNPLEE